MSKFAVEVKTISEVIVHPNADNLTIYKLNGLGYQMISNVKYEVGASVVFFPVDSVMPLSLIELFGLANFLTGKDKNRVKTVRLRKEVSQGFICDIQSIVDLLKVPATQLSMMDLTEALGVIKWEPEPTACTNGNLVKLPEVLSMYDIEGCDNYPDIIKMVVDQKIPVLITEKLEGQNFSVTVMKDGKEYVSQRRFSIVEKDGGQHDMWEVARREGILELVKSIRQDIDADDVTVYGEHCGPGVQGNYYMLKERTVYFFDLKINGKWVGGTDFLQIMTQKKMLTKVAPILAQNVLLEDWLAGKPVHEASNGKSVIHKDRLREGIVIRPMTEAQVPSIGRLIIKQRDRIYLDKTDN